MFYESKRNKRKDFRVLTWFTLNFSWVKIDLAFLKTNLGVSSSTRPFSDSWNTDDRHDDNSENGSDLA